MACAACGGRGAAAARLRTCERCGGGGVWRTRSSSGCAGPGLCVESRGETVCATCRAPPASSLVSFGRKGGQGTHAYIVYIPGVVVRLARTSLELFVRRVFSFFFLPRRVLRFLSCAAYLPRLRRAFFPYEWTFLYVQHIRANNACVDSLLLRTLGAGWGETWDEACAFCAGARLARESASQLAGSILRILRLVFREWLRRIFGLWTTERVLESHRTRARVGVELSQVQIGYT